MSDLKKIANATYIIPKEGGMLVEGLIIATKELMDKIDIERPLEQVRNVAFLPGIVGYSIAMPDIHWGYGFPIGGVAAIDPDIGVISPGGVGYDINCGVSLCVVNEPFNDISENVKDKLLQSIFNNVPSGVGRGRKGIDDLSDRDFRELLEKGAKWSIRQGYGLEADLEHIESKGRIEGASIDVIGRHALDRGRKQLGTIGSGNHFIEIGEVQKIFLPDVANIWNIRTGQTYILIHSGSRGFGHQVCQDTLNTFIKQGFAENLPDRQLVAAPIKSKYGRNYFAAMAGAANYAFNNRQQILHLVRESFKSVMNLKPEEIRLIYDVCHNIAKFEEYNVAGQTKKLLIHRKGATRAFGPGHPELADIFQTTGQPVIVPGDMGSASHLMVGLGNSLTWCSSCHGAGRQASRVQSRKAWRGKDPFQHMKKLGVKVMASSIRTITEEMPDAYKDVDQVVEAVQKAGLANMVARLKPHLVIKG